MYDDICVSWDDSALCLFRIGNVYGRRVCHWHCVPVIMNRVEQTIAIRRIVHTCYPFTPAISLMDSLHAICRVSVFIVWRNPFHLAVRVSPSQPTPESIHFTHICIFILDFWVHSGAVLELNRLCRNWYAFSFGILWTYF